MVIVEETNLTNMNILAYRVVLSSVAFHHPQQHSLDQSVLIHSTDVAENLEFALAKSVTARHSGGPPSE